MHTIQSPLPHFNDRPADTIVDTLVIHSIYAISTPTPLDPVACIKALDEHKVSSHYLISQEGKIYLLVPENKRAWHAGVSKMPFSDDTRENVNDFSIGIELVASPESGFSHAHYLALSDLTADMATRQQIKNIVGHDRIAPGRKTDPGDCFAWATYSKCLAERSVTVRMTEKC